MKVMHRTALVLALAGTLAIPATTLLASEPHAQDEHAAHHPDAAQAPASTPVDMQTMRNRMREIHQTRDPEKRKALIKVQMKDMEALLRDSKLGCPMADGKGGMGMMRGGGMGMMGGKGGMGMMGQGMQSGMGMAGQDDMMAKRMEMMEKRMDMMQTMLQMRMGSGMQGGMGMSGQDDMMAKRMEMMEKRMDMMQKGMGPGMQGGMEMPAR